MKKILFILFVFFITIQFSCKNENENDSLVGTKWESMDKKMCFTFDTDSTCTMDFSIGKQTVYYTYTYTDPNITLTTPLSTGFGSYTGVVSGDIMKIKIINSNFDDIIFEKIK